MAREAGGYGERKARGFEYTDDIHSMDSPRAMVPHIVRALRPASVVDIGCGRGNFLRCFKEMGVSRVLGVDGPWADGTVWGRNLEPGEFLAVNLAEGEMPEIEDRFDLVLCLEVAEHLPAGRSGALVDLLTGLGPVVVFSAAIPGQGGQGHLNEQWPSYWVDRFRERGFEAHDVIRPLLWSDERIHWWYRQNTILFTGPGRASLAAGFGSGAGGDVRALVHPTLYENRRRQLEDARSRLRTYDRSLAVRIVRKVGRWLGGG